MRGNMSPSHQILFTLLSLSLVNRTFSNGNSDVNKATTSKLFLASGVESSDHFGTVKMKKEEEELEATQDVALIEKVEAGSWSHNELDVAETSLQQRQTFARPSERRFTNMEEEKTEMEERHLKSSPVITEEGKIKRRKRTVQKNEQNSEDNKKAKRESINSWQNGEEVQQMKMKKIAAESGLLTTTTTTTRTSLRSSHNNQNSNSLALLKCRVEKDLYLDYEEYKHYTCASCYNNLPRNLFKRKLNFNKADRFWLYDDQTKRLIFPNETQTILATFKTDSTYEKWTQCCHQALDCCESNQVYASKLNQQEDNKQPVVDQLNRDFCPGTWDGLGCWPLTKANSIAQHLCPDHVYFLEFVPVCKGIVTKQCFPNGSWFIRNDHEWSDYSNCAPLTIYATRMLIGAIWHIISALIIGPALMLLNKLPNRGGSKRVKILQNLMFWLLLNSILAAVHKIGVLGGIFHPGANPQDDFPSNRNSNHSSSSGSFSGGASFTNTSATPNGTGPLYSLLLLQGLSDQPVVPATATTPNLTSHLTRRQIFLHHSPSSFNLDEPKFLQELAQMHTNHHDSSQTNESDFDYYNMLTSDARNQTERTLKRQQQQLKNQVSLKGQDEDQRRSGNGHLRQASDDSQLFREKRQKASSSYDRINNEEQHTTTIAEPADSLDNNYSLTLFTNNNLLPHVPPPSSALILSASGNDHQDNNKSEPHRDQTNIVVQQQRHSSPPPPPPPSTAKHKDLSRRKRSRGKRNASSYQFSTAKQSKPAIMFICWILSLGLRITRMLGYSWMFTGAVYLCSVLHFAPAEPPALFVKWLMVVTDAFPITVGIIYVTTRSLYEPSPLNIIIELPYYYILGDYEHTEYLWRTQLSCWMFSSNFTFIEAIVDYPNLLLVCLNGGLFIVTLIIMCRISRPGCTRHEMSLGDYFKAAGTLVVLYGAHYSLLASRPNVDGCIQGQVIYYAFLFVDGIQGISVSYVFCYRTQEGREILSKYWHNCRDRGPDCCIPKSKLPNEHGLMTCESNKSNQSTRSNNSTSAREATTELIDLDGSPEVEF